MAAREDMAAYMRARRARLKSEAEQAVADGDARKPKGIEARRARRRAEREAVHAAPRKAITKASAAEIATVRAKVAAIGPTAAPAPVPALAPVRALAVVPTARKPTAPVLHREPSEPSRELAAYRSPLQGEVVPPPPRSMIASGGTPPERYAPGASIAEVTAAIRALASQQGRVNAEMAARLAAVERVNTAQAAKIAALEEKRSGVIAVVQGIASIFSLVGP
jgi:hypothetical protein